ncbi:MAG: aminotransferase class IV [Vampirovibrionales bacterium]
MMLVTIPQTYLYRYSEPHQRWHAVGDTLPAHWLPSLQLGYNVFTTFRSDSARCWQHAHVKRVQTQARYLGLSVPALSVTQWVNQLTELIQSMPNEASPFVCRLTAMYIAPDTVANPLAVLQSSNAEAPHHALPTVWVLTLRPAPATPTAEQAWRTEPSLGLQPVAYTHPLPHLKHGGVGMALAVQRQACLAKTKLEEAVWIDSEGVATESTHGGLVWLDTHGQWWTPATERCLASITVQQLRKALQQLGIPLQACTLPLATVLPTLQACWCGNSVRGWLAVHRIGELELPKADSWSASHHTLIAEVFTQWYRLSVGMDSCYRGGGGTRPLKIR